LAYPEIISGLLEQLLAAMASGAGTSLFSCTRVLILCLLCAWTVLPVIAMSKNTIMILNNFIQRLTLYNVRLTHAAKQQTPQARR